MATSPFDSGVYRDLLHDEEIGRLFGDAAVIEAMMRVEGALARVQGRLGLIPAASAAAIDTAMRELRIDPASLAAGTRAAGIPAPALVDALREALQAPGHAHYLHWGATSQDANVRLGPLVVQYPRGTYLSRGDQVALAIIRDSIAERPIYFAWTGGLLRALGLQDYGVRQGLATRLLLRDLDVDQGFVKADDAVGGEWVDLERSRRISNEVMMARSLRYRDIWADRSTLNIPYYYFHFSRLLFQLGSAAGLPAEEVARFRSDMEAFGITMRGGYRAIPAPQREAG